MNKILLIVETIAMNPHEIDRLHALILLAEDWGIDPHDDDGTSLHSVLTVLSYHAIALQDDNDYQTPMDFSSSSKW